PNLTVHQNLDASARLLTVPAPDVQRRMRYVFDLLPELDAQHDQLVATLSGGQQQMVALARVLIHEPEILLIDELSLGLAPLVVERLLTVVERLKAQGQTMLIVEQSLNVALSIADRAIFLDKGSVRFEGPAQDLLGRDDLVRAVFFGAEGG
ncbi:MAG: ATP-binding cassette domain-containing protein, partial [Acidimicrobiales bacterium]